MPNPNLDALIAVCEAVPIPYNGVTIELGASIDGSRRVEVYADDEATVAAYASLFNVGIPETVARLARRLKRYEESIDAELPQIAADCPHDTWLRIRNARLYDGAP